LAEGTLSSRLHTARRTLAQRLSRYGLGLSAGALATALTRRASAAVPSPLLVFTVKVASGQAVAASAAVALSKEVLKTMFLAKLKLAFGAVVVVAALGAGGVAYQVGGPRAVQAAADGKPLSELESLRKENELLRYNLQVILEKSRAQEAELRTLKDQAAAAKVTGDERRYVTTRVDLSQTDPSVFLSNALPPPDPAQQVETALRAFREAKDPEAKRRAADSLEQAVKKLKERPQKKPEKPSNQEGKK
jgi:hypothetical protein